MNPAEKKKAGARQLWAAALYATRTVLRFKPRLFVTGILDEVFNRTVPFIEAFLAARIITLLPGVVDEVQRDDAMRTILLTLGLLLLVRVLQQVESGLYKLYESREELDLNAKVSRRLTEKFASLPYARYEEKAVLDQYDLATQYSNQLSNFVLFRMRTMAGAVYTVVLAAIAITQFSPLLTLILTVVAIPQLVIEFRVNREQRKLWRESTVTRRKADTFGDLFRPYAIKDSRLFGLIRYALDQSYHLGKAAQLEQLHVDRGAEKYRLAGRFLDAAVEVGSLAYIVKLIYNGSQPIGQFVFAQQILSRYSGALGEVVWIVQELDEYLAGATEFHTFMQLPDSQPGVTHFSTDRDITFQDVSFVYPGAKRAALRNVTLTIRSGQTVAFVGENGAGKTTLVKLLMKLYEPTQGRVMVGEQDLQDLDENAWHDRLGVLFQDFISFTDFTVRENVVFGRLERRDDNKAVRHALKQSGADDFVRRLPKGVDTYLGKYMDEENGTLLSGGQLQRLAIARVLFRDPDVLIMDEPTSAVDAKAEYSIFQELEKSRSNKTTVLISHRFSTVRKADYIFVLEKGRLVEQGSHDELIELEGLYAELFNAQAEGYR
jgi:ATP-binding cassette subfamily B protein